MDDMDTVFGRMQTTASIMFAVGVAGVLIPIAYFGAGKNQTEEELHNQPNQTQVESTPSTDQTTYYQDLSERINELYWKTPKTTTERSELKSKLEKRIEIAKNNEDYSRFIKDHFNLADVIYQIEDRSNKNHEGSINTYKKTIKLIKKHDAEKSLIDDSYLKIGDILVDSGNIKEGVFAYLDGLREYGDLQGKFIDNISITNKQSSIKVRSAIKNYINNNPNKGNELYNIFKNYSAQLEEEINKRKDELVDHERDSFIEIKENLDKILKNVLSKYGNKKPQKNNHRSNKLQYFKDTSKVAYKVQMNKLYKAA